MKHSYGCDKQTGRQSVTSRNVSSHISKGSLPRFCKTQKNTNFKVNFNRIYTYILKSVALTCGGLQQHQDDANYTVLNL